MLAVKLKAPAILLFVLFTVIEPLGPTIKLLVPVTLKAPVVVIAVAVVFVVATLKFPFTDEAAKISFEAASLMVALPVVPWVLRVIAPV